VKVKKNAIVHNLDKTLPYFANNMSKTHFVYNKQISLKEKLQHKSNYAYRLHFQFLTG